MRGRTNVGGGGAAEIYADTEIFTVAEGSNVTAGNFVQYKLTSDDRKYDTGYSAGEYIYNSNNQFPKVIPIGNGRYIRRYKNNSENNTYWFNLVDVSAEFNIKSSFSVQNEFVPAFFLLNDGNMALCYMENDNEFTLEIYGISDGFTMLGSYNFLDESVGTKGQTHMTQLGDSRIIMNNGNAYCICDYENGVPTLNFFGNFEITSPGSASAKLMRYGDNDWNLYYIGEDEILLFSCFGNYYNDNIAYASYYNCHLIKMTDFRSTEIKRIEVPSEGTSFYPNANTWGNAFAINGKILYSRGGRGFDVGAGLNSIYYVKSGNILQSNYVDIFQMMVNAFSDAPSSSVFSTKTSMTVQYTKEDVIYVAIEPDNPTYGNQNSADKVAIMRMEYNPNSAMFTTSNIVSFKEGEWVENGHSKYKAGYGQFFENDNGDVYYLYETSKSVAYKKTGRWLMKLSYKNGVLSIGENTGLVENYNASGAAIGVAKQSGSAGQEIEVYVPKA